jgi:uncharacterized membrane protein YdjX (TVP38/TMEM64 family)
MAIKLYSLKFKILAVTFICALLFLGFWYRIPLWEKIKLFYGLFTDREQVKAFITSFGSIAPLVFIFIQILQVLFAPFPGEATGFIGGYLFGTLKGFIFSSIGLTVGSWINFLIGRVIGMRYIRKLIPTDYSFRFDKFVKHQGILVLFILFVIPGFPKDYLCIFLGLSALPVKVFIILAAIGRMPGTFMLSLQGASLLEQKYAVFALLLGFCLLVCFFAYRYRDDLYRWIERMNNKK